MSSLNLALALGTCCDAGPRQPGASDPETSRDAIQLGPQVHSIARSLDRQRGSVARIDRDRDDRPATEAVGDRALPQQVRTAIRRDIDGKAVEGTVRPAPSALTNDSFPVQQRKSAACRSRSGSRSNA
jgi:hypothetical protein